MYLLLLHLVTHCWPTDCWLTIVFTFICDVTVFNSTIDRYFIRVLIWWYGGDMWYTLLITFVDLDHTLLFHDIHLIVPWLLYLVLPCWCDPVPLMTCWFDIYLTFVDHDIPLLSLHYLWLFIVFYLYIVVDTHSPVYMCVTFIPSRHLFGDFVDGISHLLTTLGLVCIWYLHFVLQWWWFDPFDIPRYYSPPLYLFIWHFCWPTRVGNLLLLVITFCLICYSVICWFWWHYLFVDLTHSHCCWRGDPYVDTFVVVLSDIHYMFCDPFCIDTFVSDFIPHCWWTDTFDNSIYSFVVVVFWLFWWLHLLWHCPSIWYIVDWHSFIVILVLFLWLHLWHLFV